METITLKMTEQEQSDLNAVFTVTLCELKLPDVPQKKIRTFDYHRTKGVCFINKFSFDYNRKYSNLDLSPKLL